MGKNVLVKIARVLPDQPSHPKFFEFGIMESQIF